jgi:hypothetical protein
MIGNVDVVQRSRATAQEVSAVAAAMQSMSQTLCHEIPDIVRKAIKADLCEFSRDDVNLSARLEFSGHVIELAVHDVNQGGVRIDVVDRLGIGGQIAVTLPSMKAIAGKIVRGGKHFGVRFAPARLRLEELRDLVTAPDQAA